MKIIHEDTKETVYESLNIKEVKQHYTVLLFFYKCMNNLYCPFILCDKP